MIRMDAEAIECLKVLGAVDKAMVILATVTASAEPLPLAEVSRRSQLPKATVHRLLAKLCAHNMVVRSGDRYSPARHAVHGTRGDGAFITVLRNESTPYLVELHNATGATATVSTRVAGKVHHVNQVYGHRGIRVIGTVVPTATDLVLRAYDTVPGPDALGELFDVRRAGIACVTTSRHGVASVAVPLSGNGTVFPLPIALSLVGPISGFDPTSASNELRRAAYELIRTIKRLMLATAIAS
jgi:IclR family acetate operon transcriptional repressor